MNIHSHQPLRSDSLLLYVYVCRLYLYPYLRLPMHQNNVEGWSTDKLLLKDTKTYNSPPYWIQISTIPMPLEEWQQKNPNMIQELAAAAKQVDRYIIQYI